MCAASRSGSDDRFIRPVLLVTPPCRHDCDRLGFRASPGCPARVRPSTRRDQHGLTSWPADSCRSTRKYTSEVPAAECSAKRAAARSARSSAAPGTASRSCSRSTRTGSTVRPMPRTSGSPTLSAPRTPGPSPNPVTREMTTASRYPEMPGQRHKAGRTVGVTAPTAPVRGFSAPVRGPSPMRTDA